MDELLPGAETLDDPVRQPRIVLFDSGLGGLTVFAELRTMRASAKYLYAADDALFPYSRLSEPDLVGRVLGLMERLVLLHRPDAVVIACNTASTLVLPNLRARWPDLPFVGTVPAIKPAASLSASRMISVLATPGTVARQYTGDLVRRFANDCDVTLVGAPNLAGLAERALRGEPVPDDAIRAELEPAFVQQGCRRTDVVVLACTHYPLLIDRLDDLAPWPVAFIDAAPAIARRTHAVLSQHGFTAAADVGTRTATAVFTAAPLGAGLLQALGHRGFDEVGCLPDPVDIRGIGHAPAARLP